MGMALAHASDAGAAEVGALVPGCCGGCFVDSVRRQFDRLEDHVPSLQEVAGRLAVSERTLRRRLRAHDTSYTEILQQVRQDSAARALLCSSLTVDEIAAMLGYTETANFRHAFRRWFGYPPQTFRLRAHARSLEAVAARAA